MTKECETCGNKYQKIGRHWHNNKRHAPSLTDKQKDIITGVVMSDGHVFKNGKNARLEVNNTNKEYLEYLKEVFGVMASDISVKRTAKESVAEHKKRNFAKNPKEENYKDIYHWRTTTHYKLNKWHKWYKSGKKVWPDDIKLTPVVLKHWYVGDGHYDTAASHNRIKLSMGNEVENTEKVTNYFKSKGLPAPSNYNISKRKNTEGKSCVAVFTKSSSKKLFKYMGESVNGFEYKWP